jgi:hypothetical protein
MGGLLQTIADGGCYWRRKEDSPGHSFAVPNGTLFKIAMDGPQSHRFRGGVCQDGYFVTNDGEKHLSASEAVNAIRNISSNAFLHMHFKIDGRWMLADSIRESDWSLPDDIEEEALQIAIGLVREKVMMTKSDADEARIIRAAAKAALQQGSIMADAMAKVEQRKRLAHMLRDIEL